jgi:hypothetical protein
MTLKLVADEAEVIPLDVYNFQDIAGCARRFADQLERGVQGEPTRVVVVLDTPDGVALAIWGENVSGFEIVGLLEVAKMHAYENNVLGDE